jgi:hypothetical protein
VRPLILILYVAMAVWLLVGAGARVVLQVTRGQPVDALPFVSVPIAVVAIGLLLIARADARRRRND